MKKLILYFLILEMSDRFQGRGRGRSRARGNNFSPRGGRGSRGRGNDQSSPRQSFDYARNDNDRSFHYSSPPKREVGHRIYFKKFIILEQPKNGDCFTADDALTRQYGVIINHPDKIYHRADHTFAYPDGSEHVLYIQRIKGSMEEIYDFYHIYPDGKLNIILRKDALNEEELSDRGIYTSDDEEEEEKEQYTRNKRENLKRPSDKKNSRHESPRNNISETEDIKELENEDVEVGDKDSESGEDENDSVKKMKNLTISSHRGENDG